MEVNNTTNDETQLAQKDIIIKFVIAFICTFIFCFVINKDDRSVSQLLSMFPSFVGEVIGYSLIPFVVSYLLLFKGKGKKNVQIAFIVVFLATLSSWLIKSISNSSSAIEKIYKNTKVTLPSMIDSETRLDSIILNEKVLVYNYTLVNVNQSNAGFLDFTALNNNFRNRICSTKILRIAINDGGEFSSNYYSSDGYSLNSFTVSKLNCHN